MASDPENVQRIPADRAGGIELLVYTSPARPLAVGGTFSPVTSTVLLGREEAVLVDSQFVGEDIDQLTDLIERSGRRLSTIFITHGHADHYFGTDRLLARFPHAHVVAAASVAAYIRDNHKAEVETFAAMLSDAIEVPTMLPSALNSLVIDLEGNELHVIDLGQGDISPSTVLHAPAANAVVTGDVTYNRIHQMLGLSTPAQWEIWINSVDRVAALTPQVVVSGHRRLDARNDEPERILNETRSYIADFAQVAAVATDAREIVTEMRRRYPEHGNPATLHFSAASAIRQRFA